jgi:hypothetical protein
LLRTRRQSQANIRRPSLQTRPLHPQKICSAQTNTKKNPNHLKQDNSQNLAASWVKVPLGTKSEISGKVVKTMNFNLNSSELRKDIISRLIRKTAGHYWVLQLNDQYFLLSIAKNINCDHLPGLKVFQPPHIIINIANRIAINGSDDVTFQHTT